MNRTKACFLVAGLMLAGMCVWATSAFAGSVPHDAGFKARGMRDSYHSPYAKCNYTKRCCCR
jgi:hypothetical protein